MGTNRDTYSHLVIKNIEITFDLIPCLATVGENVGFGAFDGEEVGSRDGDDDDTDDRVNDIYKAATAYYQ